jgi:dolichol-phosphate mannosyltransferase
VTKALLAHTGFETRFILVDDGSTDGSWDMIVGICDRLPAFRGVRLSRNFGAHVAICAGLDVARGDAIAILACDLQDPPETIVEFLDAWRSGADIVWGARSSREGEPFRRILVDAMIKVLRRFAMPRGSRFTTGSFLLIDARVAECVRRFREHSRVTFALVAWTGFDQEVVYFDRRARQSGQSGWGLGKLFSTVYDVFIGFSPAPAFVITAMGLFLSFLSLSGLAMVLLEWAFYRVQPGWTGIMATITLFFGMLFMMMGLLGEYLSRIFVEVKNRPLYFVADQTDAADAPPPP